MRIEAPSQSLLLDPERHELHPPDAARGLGSTVVFAPHPDDESLGCGGLLALLAHANVPACVVVLTDGSRSHPNSPTYPASRLAAVREQETLDAVEALGLAANAVQFLRLSDCGLPALGTTAFAETSARLRELIVQLAPDTLLVPWRRDPHCDHQAANRLLCEAVRGLDPRPHWLEYPVWAWPQADNDLAPRANEGRAWRLDIAPVLARKIQAIAQHASQLGALIRDDDSGFVLQPEMLAHFTRSWELFVEPTDV